jgi:hypothetical protein
MNRLSNRLRELIQACFTGIWIETQEWHDALEEIRQLCRGESWRLLTWDISQGLRSGDTTVDGVGKDPISTLQAIARLGDPQGTTVVVLQGLNRFLGSAEVIQALANQLQAGKQTRVFLVVLAPTAQLPPELEKAFLCLQHQLPDRDELRELARGLVAADEFPNGLDLSSLLDAAAGLTRAEAENAFSLSLVRANRLAPAAIWELKAQSLRKSGALTLYRGGADFAQLGGLQGLKAFCLRALRRRESNTGPRPKGLLLLSPPGCGKSQFCKALGAETGRPVLMLNLGAVMGSLVGQSEERLRTALQVADAMAPCVLMLDEIEKAFAGVGSQGDSGVTARLFGEFLTWLNDRTTDVFVVATSNDIGKLPPEFSRAERFDGVFFLDLPSPEERELIWEYYNQHYQVDPGQQRPRDHDWTGAEIQSCCRLSALLDVPLKAAAQNVVPVAVSAQDAVERLRTWADGRCLCAAGGGIYRQRDTPTPTKRRAVRS